MLSIFKTNIYNIKIIKFWISIWQSAESNEKLPHLSIPGKTAVWVPEFAVEDLPFGRITALFPEFAVKDLPLGRMLLLMVNIENSKFNKIQYQFPLIVLNILKSKFVIIEIILYILCVYVCVYLCLRVCKIFCPEAGPSLDIH